MILLKKKEIIFFEAIYNKCQILALYKYKRLKELPMDENFTLEKKNAKNSDRKESMQPKKSTLEFLKQFARVYHAEMQLDSTLRGIVLNW